MKLPDIKPVKENAVITSPEELIREIKEMASESGGVFIKLFGKKGNSRYYITVLFDRTKLLAAEGQEVDSNTPVVGDEAVNLLKELLKGPVIVDVYPLDEIGVKLSIADNLDIYGQTPKVPIDELFTGKPVTQPAPVQKPKEIPKPAPKPSPEAPKPKPPSAREGGIEIVIEIPGGEVLEEALKEYTKHLLSEAKRIRTLRLNRVVYSGELSGGVVYLDVHLYGHSEGQMREIAEKRMLHAISKHAPVILRIADIKPILRNIKVILDGREVAPQEIVEKDKKKVGKVDREGRITLAVLEDVWPYFSAMARTVVGELQEAGVIVRGANFDVKGRREFEVNAKLAVETSLPEDQVERLVKDVISRHTKELGRTLNRYMTVHNVEVEFIKKPEASVVHHKAVTSGKAAQILERKAELEKEVEKLLKQAGIEELSFLTEEKKRESEETMLRSRIEPAMEALKSRLHTELKLIPRVTFKWLKLNWDVKDTTVYIEIEASFLKEEVGGLFGAFSGVDENKLKQDARETILRVIRDISKEYSVKISLKKLNVIIR